MRDLVLLACSARKRPKPRKPFAAIERYDGVFFRVLRKWRRTLPTGRPAPDVLIVSARFGLIGADTAIPNYDLRMTPELAAELGPQVQKALRSRLTGKRYRRMFVNLGRDYLATVAGVEELKHARWATGGIGKRASQMKHWLEALAQA